MKFFNVGDRVLCTCSFCKDFGDVNTGTVIGLSKEEICTVKWDNGGISPEWSSIKLLKPKEKSHPSTNIFK